jgi:hypothetical protein
VKSNAETGKLQQKDITNFSIESLTLNSNNLTIAKPGMKKTSGIAKTNPTTSPNLNKLKTKYERKIMIGTNLRILLTEADLLTTIIFSGSLKATKRDKLSKKALSENRYRMSELVRKNGISEIEKQINIIKTKEPNEKERRLSDFF